MSHKPNPQHLPPAKSPREYEAIIEERDALYREMLDWLKWAVAKSIFTELDGKSVDALISRAEGALTHE